jgi:phosphotransferase system HPr (HPr) family protein
VSERSVKAQRALHARPASELAGLAAGFEATVEIEVGERSANAKSVLSLMAIDLEAGDEVTVRASGDDAELALAAVSELLGAAEGDGG